MMSTYRRVLLLALACSLTAVAVLMDRGYVTVTATVQLVDMRDVQAELACDFEDALDIVGAAKLWMTEPEAWAAVKLRAEILGWTHDADDGWIRGREMRVLLAWDNSQLDLSHVYMRRGELLAFVRDPTALSVCGGPLVHPFPTPAEFDVENCRELDRMYAVAAYRILCAWLDVC